MPITFKNLSNSLTWITRNTAAVGATLSCSLLLGASVAHAQEAAAEKITYDDHAKAVLVQRCSSCHNGQKKEGDLDVTNYINLMQGGGSGAVIEPLDSGGSYLYKLITHEDSPEMPPSGVKIPDPEIAVIKNWIDGGALENKGSAAAKPKPKLSMSLAANPTARPEVLPTPLRIPLEPVIVPDRPSVLAIATNPWAPVAAISTPKQIHLYNTSNFEHAGVLEVPEGGAHSLRFSRNGQLLIAGGGKDAALGKAIVFDARTGERALTVGEELETLLAADISPDQQYVAYGGPTKLVKLLYTDGTLVAEIKKHTDWVTALEFSPDGKYFASGDRSGGLYVFDGQGGDLIFTLKGHTDLVSGVSWRPDSQFLASSSEDGSVRIWELKNGTQVKTWGAHGGGATGIEFKRDGNLVTAGRDKLVKLWDQNGTMVRQFTGLTDVAVAVSYCDESDRIIASDWTGAVKVWNAADGKELASLPANPPTLAARLAQSEAVLAQVSTEHQPIKTQVDQTEAKLTEINQTLTASTAAMTEMQGKMVELEKQYGAAKQLFDSTSTQHAQWLTERDAKAKAIPSVAQSLTTMKEALVSLPEDAELKASIATLEQKKQQLDARLAELNGLVEKSGQEKMTSQTQMTQLAAAMETTKVSLTEKSAEVTQLQSEMASVSETQKQQQALLQQADQKLQNATAVVNQRKSDIAFVAELKALKDQVQASEQTIAQQQAEVDAMHQALIEAQAKVDAAKAQKAATEQQAEAIRKQIEALRASAATR